MFGRACGIALVAAAIIQTGAMPPADAGARTVASTGGPAPGASSPRPTQAVTAPAGLVQSLNGVYKVRFPNGDASGRSYTSENVLEIVPYGANAAYVRVRLEFYNGHRCAVWGIATVEDGKLVYQESTPTDARHACHVEIALKGEKVALRDTLAADGIRSCVAHCGARGSMTGEWPYAERRAIRYMRILLASREYQAAVSEFERARATPGAPGGADGKAR